MIFGIGGTIKAVVALFIVLAALGGFWYVTGLKANLAISEANNAKLIEATSQQGALIEQLQKDISQIQEINKDLSVQGDKRKQDIDALARKFDKRDFGVFASENTIKAQTLVNRGTKNALRCIELASGAPLTEEEKNAKSPVEANRECPSLIDPSFKPILN
jgi:hypothetical protein